MRGKFNQALLFIGLVSAWAVIAMWAPSSALKVATSSAFLMCVPGNLLYRLLIRDDESRSFWATLAYSVAFSSLFLMLTGLILSVIGPALGLSQPLSVGPLVATISAATAVLAGLVLKVRGRLAPTIHVRKHGFYNWLIIIYGALLPILSILGAIRLNNGASNSITLLMFAMVAFYAVWLVWPKNRQVHNLYPYALFMAGAALLFATSMRGMFITGHDIVQEYQVFQLTLQHGVWSMNWLQNAYTACLSITILPTILARLTSISDPYVYKLLFQFMFALVPPVIYLTVERFLPRRAAFLSAFVFVSFPTFLTDMPMLCRQEMAFLFFMLMLLTLFETRLTPRLKSALVMIMGLGMILSHYSTSYVAIGIIIAAKLFEFVVLRWDRWRHRNGGVRMAAMPLSWPLALSLLLTVYLWNSLLTNTGEGITSTIGGIAVSLPQILDNTAVTGAASYSLVSHALSNTQLFHQYTSTVTTIRDLKANNYYPASVTSKYPIQASSEIVAPATSVGRWLTNLHVPLYFLYDNIRSGYAKLIQVLMLGGLALIAFRKQHARIPRQFVILGFSSVVMIVLEVFLPNVINYGLLRLIQQSLIFLGPAVIMACYFIFGLLRFSPIWRVRMTALMFVGFFVVNAGVLTAFTGGYQPSMTTSNSGFYYEAYYAHADELAGFSWLATNTPKGAVVNSDEFARREMITYSNIYSRATIAPAAISKGAYVYLSYGDTTFNEVPLYYDGALIYEKPPVAFLNDNKDLLYNNGAVKVYR
ncbi:MAG TPA: DUF2206 domain-containing protein [Candidatus Saccharimonadia bacterium]|nr:DUF2206 domain-containing protein [Candidatus Saccharimonadia bacterium]